MPNDWPARAIERALQSAAAAGPTLAFEFVREVDSTNSELMRRARSGRLAPVLLVAGSQTAGRGRLGRQWISGGVGESLTFSMLVPLAPRDWSGLSLAVGVALADSLDPGRAHGIGLKWPNDLWLRGRKLAGILIETVACAPADSRRRRAVVGVGINIGEPRVEEGSLFSTPPAWLREIDPAADAASALLRVAGPLLSALFSFETAGFAPYHSRFDARDVLRDRPVTVAGGNAEPLEGTAHGVSETGALLVHTNGAMRQIDAMEVSVRPARFEESR